VVISYTIADAVAGPLSIRITDAQGNLVRRYSSEADDFDRCVTGNMTPRLAYTMNYPTVEPGLNQWVWDMRREGLTCIDDIRLFAGFSGATVTPGQYSVSVSLGDHSDTTDFALSPDLRVEATPADYAFLDAKRSETADMLNELLTALDNARRARTRIEALMRDNADSTVLSGLSTAAISKINAWENRVTQTGYKTYEDEDSMPPMLDVHIRHVFDVIDRAGAPVSEGSLLRLSNLKEQWVVAKTELSDIIQNELYVITKWAANNEIPHIPLSLNQK
jgi:hypothetical protein